MISTRKESSNGREIAIIMSKEGRVIELSFEREIDSWNERILSRLFRDRRRWSSSWDLIDDGRIWNEKDDWICDLQVASIGGMSPLLPSLSLSLSLSLSFFVTLGNSWARLVHPRPLFESLFI